MTVKNSFAERSHANEKSEKQEQVQSALRRLEAAGIDPIIPRGDCLVALALSAPTVSRMQRRNELPKFEEISPGRKGWRRPILLEVLEGRREWLGRPAA